MSVVRRESLRRWSLVTGGVAVLLLLPSVVAAWPVTTAGGEDPAALYQRILASQDQPYQGYVATDGRLGLPALPQLAEVGGLLGGSATLRAWYAGPDRWRVAELTPVGERDTYRTGAGLFRWDFERNQATFVAGEPVVWLPSAADLVPPTLARRLLAAGGEREPLPARRVAGIDAAGVRLTPEEDGTSVGRVDVWADPATGLPVRVEVGAGPEADPAFTSRFLQLRPDAPGQAVLTPTIPPGAGYARTTAVGLADALATALPGELPGTLAGRPQTSQTATADIPGGAVYGTGLASVVVLALPGRIAGDMLGAAEDAGGTPVSLPGAEAYQMRASLMTALVVHADHPPGPQEDLHAWLLAGLVDPQLLVDGATELVDSA